MKLRQSGEIQNVSCDRGSGGHTLISIGPKNNNTISTSPQTFLQFFVKFYCQPGEVFQNVSANPRLQWQCLIFLSVKKENLTNNISTMFHSILNS
jgi:hypothetical protein